MRAFLSLYNFKFLEFFFNLVRRERFIVLAAEGNHISREFIPGKATRPTRVTVRALAAAGITRLEQFTTISEAELLKLHGMGPKAVETLKQAMRENDLSFANSDQSAQISEKTNQ